MKQKTFYVGFTGGGTGGHVYPLIAVSNTLQDLGKKYGFVTSGHYFGPKDSYTVELENAGMKHHSIMAAKWRRYFSVMNIVDIPKFFIGVVQSFWQLFWSMPEVIFSKGGTGSLPVILTSWFYRIPVIIHESDSAPGLNNLISSYFVKKIAITFGSALKYFSSSKTFISGGPIRKEIQEFKDSINRFQAKEMLGFNRDLPLILFLGGSQGANKINEFVVVNLKNLIENIQILHQTGKENYEDIKKLSLASLVDIPIENEIKNKYSVVPFLGAEDMGKALVAADIVVSRGGSNAITEISYFGKASIIIPYPGGASDHQKQNAYAFADSGAALVIEEPNLEYGIFIKNLILVLNDSNIRNKMESASLKFSKMDASERIAEEIIKLGSQ